MFRNALCGLVLTTVMGCQPDGDIEPDVDSDTDTDVEIEAHIPTWGQCRTKWAADTLSPDEKALCDTHQTTAPETWTFGIRWIALDDSNGDIATEVESHLIAVNELFGEVGMTFETRSLVTHPDPMFDLFSATDTTVTLRSLASDLAVYLDIDSTEPDAVFEALKVQMASTGVSDTALSELDLDAPLTSQVYWSTVARAFGDEIVIVLGRPGESPGQGGVSAPPRGAFDGTTTQLVFLRYDRLPEMHAVLAHELGHYFGLMHTFQGSSSEGGVREVSVNKQAITAEYGRAQGSLAGIENAFWEQVGTNDIPSSNFLPYDTDAETLQAAEKRRLAVQTLLPHRDFTYTGDFESFETLEGYVSSILDTPGQVKLKNYQGDKGFNNCAEASATLPIECEYTSGVVTGSDPLLDQSLTAEDGLHANLMSYIRLEDTSHTHYRKFLTDGQKDVVHMNGASQQRLNLRRR